MPRYLLPLCLCLLPRLLLADSLDGHYLTTLDGQPAEMHLRSQEQQVSGEYVEGATLRLQISGSFDGELLRAQISEPQSGQLIANMNATYANGILNSHIVARSPHSGAILERKALFHRQPVSAAALPRQISTPARDPALVGTWVHEAPLNSSAADLAKQMVLQLRSDGSMSQWQRDVVSGSTAPKPTPDELLFSGLWQSSNGLLEMQLHGQSSYQPAAYYRLSGQQLITESNTSLLTWQRQAD